MEQILSEEKIRPAGHVAYATECRQCHRSADAKYLSQYSGKQN